MSISAISSGSSFQMPDSTKMAQMQKDFSDLGSALSSGNLDDAKKAYAQLQKDAPVGGDSKNPMSSDIASLGKALDSGDLKGAQKAYSDIQQKMSQGPPAGGTPKGAPPQGAQTDTVQLSSQASAKSTTSDNKVYEKKDTNNDGTVSIAEELAYDQAHPKGESSTTVEKADSNQEKPGVQTYA
jgi:hypothetical protein